MHLWQVSLICLLITGVLCIIGVLAHAYEDNLGQRVAMALHSIACFSRVKSISMTEVVMIDWLMIHIGMALFASSTAWRVFRRIKHRRRRHGDDDGELLS